MLLALSCNEKEERSAAPAEQSGEQENQPALEPELAEAVAAASASAAAGPAPGTPGQEGPPPRGIFPPGGADAQIGVEAPPVITVGSTGSEPRMQLTGGFGTKANPVTARVEVMLQSGPGGLPVDFDLQFEESPLAAPAAAREGEAGDAEATPRPRAAVRGRVVGAQVPQGLGQVPAPVKDAVAKLRGVEVAFDLWPNGAATGLRTEMKAGMPAELGDVVRALGDAIAAVTLPYPDEPLGVGGFWMVTSRDGLMGLDLVSYRLARVESIVDGAVTLRVSTKRYAASDDFSLPSLDGSYLLEELQSGGEGALRYRSGRSLPFRGRFQLSLSALVSPRGAPAGAAPGAQRGTLQFVSEARFSEP